MIPHIGILAAAVGAVGTAAGTLYAEVASVPLDSTAVIVAVIGSIPPTLLAYAALRAANGAKVSANNAEAKTIETAKAVDGVVSKLMTSKDQTLVASVAAASAEGQLAGQQKQRDLQAAPEQVAPLPVVIAAVEPTLEPIPVKETAPRPRRPRRTKEPPKP